MLQFFLKKLFKEVVNGESFPIGGLLPHVSDPRDFKYSDLGGWFDYKPKHKSLVLPMFEVKNQGSLNTCIWHSYAASRENTEGVTLSPRSIVLYAKGKGLLRADGLSTLREGQQAGKDFGIAEEKLVPNDLLPWGSYSGLQITTSIRENATKHRSKSYFVVRGRNEWLKALDDGHCIHTGSDWYSSYNMATGFKAPWVLGWRKGWKVGGHAYTCRGYDLSEGRNLLRFRNSFGPSWGDSGDFYARMSDIFNEEMIGYVSIDLEGDNLVEFITSHANKDVKSNTRPSIYRIEDGKRRPYPDALAFYAFGGQFPPADPTFEQVSNTLLDLIPEGEPMMPENSPYWQFLAGEWETLRWSGQDYALHRIHEIITTSNI